VLINKWQYHFELCRTHIKIRNNEKIFHTAMLIFSSTFLFAQVSMKQADQIVQEYLESEKIPNDYWLYANDVAIENQSIKTLVNNYISVDNSSWVYFIEEHPFASWSHKCRYVFVNKNTGTIISKAELYPPKNIEKWRMLTNFPALPEGKKFSFIKSQTILKSGIEPENCYAVIISGGADPYWNWVRYWNDCEAIYSALVDIYGYLDDHIYVLVSDGVNPGYDRHHYNGTYDSSPLDLDGDGDNDIQYSAIKSNITSVFNTLSGILGSEDYLFIYTTDHGGQQSGDDVYINLWNETMNDDEFATEVNKVNAGHISVVMEQCHSGGFVSDLSSLGRVIATACTADEGSCAISPYTYDEFVYHWTAAVVGEDPYGNIVDADNNNDGFISMKEAFDFAEAQDRCSETPQYNSTKAHLGNFLTLLGSEACTTNYIHNINITSDTTVTDCKIDVENVTIQNNSSVVLNAAEDVIINGEFEVKISSTFEIK